MRYLPHQYQDAALRWLIQRTILDGHQGAALFLDPGAGKTSTTLAWFRLLRMLGLAEKALIVAPLRVVYSVWPREIAKWDQFAGLKVSIIHGNPKQRLKALEADTDIYLVNTDGVSWLQKQYEQKSHPWDVLIVDESSPFKNWGAARTKALRKLVPRFRLRLILTGTPSPNGLEDLFSQVWIVDRGEALGANITQYRKRYFFRGGYGGYKWIPNESSGKLIEYRIKNLCLRMSAADHLDLPELITNDVWVDLPTKAAKQYKQLEKEMFILLSGGDELTPLNAGAKYNACKQIANGGVYDENHEALEIHNAKIDAVTDIVAELQGKPVMIAFQYKHDLGRLRKIWPNIPTIDGSTKPRETDELVEKWNDGALPLLAVQPQALSHGLNLQNGPGRDLIWLGLTDNLETYLQLNARIYRQGVSSQVRIHRILASKTVDEAVRDRIRGKDQSQRALLNALNEYGSKEL